MNRSCLILVCLLFSAIRIIAANFSVEVDGLVYKQNLDDTTTVSLTCKSDHWNWSSSNNYSQTSITVPPSILVDGVEYRVTALAERALNNCHNLTSVYLPNTIKKLGYYAFSCCDNLKELILPDSLEYIGPWAFFNCHLDKLVVPPSLKEFGFSAFYSEIGASGASNVYISDLSAWLRIKFGSQDANPTRAHFFLNNEPIKNLVIPNDIDEINSSALAYIDCETITIPDHVMGIADYAFYGCKAKEIKIGTGIAEIGSWALSYCSNVESITLGQNVSKIYTPNFNNIGKIKTIFCNSLTPPSISNHQAFTYFHGRDDDEDEYTLDDVTLIVPTGTQRAYRDAETWKRFGHIKEVEDNAGSLLGDMNGDSIVDVSDVNVIINIILGKYNRK